MVQARCVKGFSKAEVEVWRQERLGDRLVLKEDSHITLRNEIEMVLVKKGRPEHALHSGEGAGRKEDIESVHGRIKELR